MLKELAADYLATRRALGFALAAPEDFLASFADFAAARGDTHVVAATVIDWAAAGRTAGVRHRRLQCLAGFARYVRAEDPRHEVPNSRVFPRVPRQVMPHIYSIDEAARLVAAAETLGRAYPMRAVTAAALISLLFATGLRISEALALDTDDITPDGLRIRRTKFNKTRLVPLHETAQAGLAQYLTWRRRGGRTPPALFLSFRGQRLGYRGVLAAFRSMCQAAGLARPPGQQQPRIHDIRHTFAVRALEACPEPRSLVAQHMLALATYLGHTRVTDTYWYLQATPSLLRDIADRVRSAFGHGAG